MTSKISRAATSPSQVIAEAVLMEGKIEGRRACRDTANALDDFCKYKKGTDCREFVGISYTISNPGNPESPKLLISLMSFL